MCKSTYIETIKEHLCRNHTRQATKEHGNYVERMQVMKREI